jgi:periplasmic divalent cation tolerance protein
VALRDGTGQLVVQTNCANAEEAQGIARAAVAAGLAACGNSHGPITSIYRWQGEVVEAFEHVLELKTTEARLEELEALIREHHSYDLPAILVLPIMSGEAGYLDWIDENSSGGPVQNQLPASLRPR